ncbi:MAG: sigma-70 family RNA polymerase sigma factor [Proteobacteria bacterium]|nr:sigma-70 family RNA polymerase sigma factor [Pseudomonadota bacterium]
MASDIELFDLWCSGDQGAGNELVRRHFDAVCRFFETKVADRAHADDLVQRTFLACVRARDQFAKRSSFRTYLFTVARHELYRHWRSQYRDRAAIDFAATSLQDLATTPTGRIARNQEHELLLRALRTMPLEQQMLLELHYWEDLGIAALAEILDIASGAMRGRLFRARQSLRQRIEELAGRDGANDAKDDDFDAWARSLRRKRLDSTDRTE